MAAAAGTADAAPPSAAAAGGRMHPLFGGAMAIGLPATYNDASAFRQVPDNQEVFVHPTNGSCVVIELLDRVATVDDNGAAVFHWMELAKANEAKGADAKDVAATVISKNAVPSPKGMLTVVRQSAKGMQAVAKFNESGRENNVHVSMTVVRIPAPYNSDIVVSLSAPMTIASGSSEGRYIDETMDVESASDLHRHLVDTFAIVDFGLFVIEERSTPCAVPKMTMRR